jgi:hypothetical protein
MTTQQIVGKIAHALVHAQGIETLDALNHLLNLARGMLGRWRPQPGLQTRSRAMWCGNRTALLNHQSWLDRMVDPSCELRLVLAPGGGDHRAEKPLVDNDEPMLIEPTTRKPE